MDQWCGLTFSFSRMSLRICSLCLTLCTTTHVYNVISDMTQSLLHLCITLFAVWTCSYRLVDVEPGWHPPQNGRVQVLRPVSSSHDDHLTDRRVRERERQPDLAADRTLAVWYVCVCAREWSVYLVMGVCVKSIPQAHELGLHHGRGFVVRAGPTPQERVCPNILKGN